MNHTVQYLFSIHRTRKGKLMKSGSRSNPGPPATYSYPPHVIPNTSPTRCRISCSYPAGYFDLTSNNNELECYSFKKRGFLIFSLVLAYKYVLLTREGYDWLEHVEKLRGIMRFQCWQLTPECPMRCVWTNFEFVIVDGGERELSLLIGSLIHAKWMPSKIYAFKRFFF